MLKIELEIKGRIRLVDFVEFSDSLECKLYDLWKTGGLNTYPILVWKGRLIRMIRVISDLRQLAEHRLYVENKI